MAVAAVVVVVVGVVIGVAVLNEAWLAWALLRCPLRT